MGAVSFDESPLAKIIKFNVNLIIKFFDNAYKDGYLMYLIVGLIGLAVIVILFN